jgi:hypothetical protein
MVIHLGGFCGQAADGFVGIGSLAKQSDARDDVRVVDQPAVFFAKARQLAEPVFGPCDMTAMSFMWTGVPFFVRLTVFSMS